MLAESSRPISKASALVIAGYAVLTLLLLPRLSLWLDELIDLLGTRGGGFHSIIEYASTNPGGAPIWYLSQGLATGLLGFSTFSARLPACIAGILSCAGLALLARRFGVKSPALCVAVFALFPLQLRYALEGRPYSEALCLSIWATLVFLQLIERPTLLNGVCYCLLIALGLYTQPFSIFVAVAHAAWALPNTHLSAKARLFTLGAILLAGAGFFPWLLYASRNWTDSLAPGTMTVLHPRVLLMLFRECLGGGYLLSGIAILVILPGLRSGTMDRSKKILLLLMVVVPIGFSLLADSLSGYFVAIRQAIFILPSMALLVCIGVEHIARRAGGRIALLAAALLLTASLAYDVRWFNKPREDWQRAADRVNESVHEGSCAVLIPERTAQIFLFFHPSLIHRIYSEEADFSTCPRVAVVMSHYAKRWPNIASRLAGLGFIRSQVIYSSEPTVTVLSR
jgi:uncharacterized membrane protein